MRVSQVPGLLALALSLAPVSARAAAVPPASLSHVLRAASVPVPASWAGIWSASDTAQACDGHSVVVVFTGLDTLCAGAAFGPDTTQYQCSGTFTDTDFDINCTGQTAITPACSAASTIHLQGDRNGDVMRTTSTLTTTYTPTLCESLLDICTVTTGTLTRVGSAPPDCDTTPTHAESWGRLKLKYRWRPPK